MHHKRLIIMDKAVKATSVSLSLSRGDAVSLLFEAECLSATKSPRGFRLVAFIAYFISWKFS